MHQQGEVVDLSYQGIDALTLALESPKNVEHLILDGNFLADNVEFPFMENLKTLSLNKNYITNLSLLCRKLRNTAPKLNYLSLIGNPACLHPALHSLNINEPSYNDYRLQVISQLPNLKFLDSCYVSEAERLYSEQQKLKFDEISLKTQENHAKYGKLFLRYRGKQSEGNRFIKDQHL